MRKLIPVAAVAAVGLAGAAIPAFAATKTISLKDNLFAPKSVTVSKGTTVKWVWKGKNTHNVFVNSGPAKFHSGFQSSGSYKHKMTKPGTYKIVCQLHPGMALTLKVK